MGVGKTGVGEMGQIIGETGVGEMGVGETGTSIAVDWDAKPQLKQTNCFSFKYHLLYHEILKYTLNEN